MGAGQSTAGPSSTAPKQGLHVLRVTPTSPASATSIEPFFDFVIGYEGAQASSQAGIDASELERIVESHEGRTLNLIVWNSQDQDTRVVPINPSREWSMRHAHASNAKEPPSDAKPSLLGLSMRICEPEQSLENVWHVMDVLEGSPAESAGLVPYGDWIIGWSGGVLSAEGDFYDVVEAHIDKPLRVYVYSHDFHTIREVVLIPNRHWGGEGLLGCVFGFGLLHRIPPRSADRGPDVLPPELEEEEEELFVPAEYAPDTGYIETPSYPNSHYSNSQYSPAPSHRGLSHIHDHSHPYQGSSHTHTNGKTVHGRGDSLTASRSGDSRSSTPVRTASLAYSHIRTPTPTRGFALTGGTSPPS